LTAVGCPELIASNLEEYEALALRLAQDGVLQGELRARLATNRATTPLFDTQRYCHDLESAYITMWERSQRAEAPQGFAVR
jgi:protein O-GlcNAc transferase